MNNADPLPGWRPRQLTPLAELRPDWMPRLWPIRWQTALRNAGRPLRAAQARSEVVIRPIDATDADLERLGGLAGSTVRSGVYVVAEIGGELVAAVPVGGGEELTDPFRPTADLVSLLELRARQLAASADLAA